MNQIIISISDFEEKAALLEGEKLTEFFIQRNEQNRINGNIYKARVANVLPGMESAFLDIGLEKNAFLHIRDLREFEGHIAISQKIKEPEERERLETTINKIKPDEMGVIIRTAAKDKNNLHFEKEIEYLAKKWIKIENNFKKSSVGETLYQDNDLVTRTVRDVFSNQIDELIIDDEDKYWEIVDYIKAFSDNTFKTKVKLFQSSLHIFDHYNVTKELETALNEKVWLDCGGYLIIQKTEALISIDVNTGRNTGILNLEDTVVETNIEAAIEIARQLRLRNLSGIIIIDFIDMKVEKDKLKVVEVLGESLKKDRIKNNIIHFTDLGLVEMTRKRQGSPLAKYYQRSCPCCGGTGIVKSKESIILDIMREIREIAEDKDIKLIRLTTSIELYDFIFEAYIEFITGYLKLRNKEFVLKKNKKNGKNNNGNYEIVMEM
ncbi:MAG: ribonuclease G [Fusobacteriia bacterium 4572_74]|nr:MAG: ribonuclease G [Fusobacteriia bacterium 4572_74]